MAHRVLVGMSMEELLADVLEAIVGGQQASGCTVTNKMDVPVILFHPRENSISTIDPGEMGAVPAGRFVAISKVAAGGLAEGECQAGRSFSASRDQRFSWKNRPALQRQ